ncbi:MAG: NusG domain II-containing protein [Faecalimonas sp.]
MFHGKKRKGCRKIFENKSRRRSFPGSQLTEEDAEITIGEHNRVKIQDGQVEMIWADCPDQICAAHPKISKNRESIICLPNKVILEIVDRADEGSKENDAVAG